jgi:hypothetical protein
MRRALFAWLVLLTLSGTARAETLAEIGARLGRETQAAYSASPFLQLAQDYYSRFTRDPEAVPSDSETIIAEGWNILLAADSPPLARRMAEELARFLRQVMGLEVPVVDSAEGAKTIHLRMEESTGEVPGCFQITVTRDAVTLTGRDAAGLRDGVVHLVHAMGNRAAPFVAQGSETHAPRLPVRLGSIPWQGSYRDMVMMGYNAALVGGGSLHALSTSDAIPGLEVRRNPALPEANRNAAAAARDFGLKTYAFLDTRQKFPKDDPIFQATPDLRGALTWKADGEYVLCTEHPLMQRWLDESMEGLFRNDPQLDGVVIIIGGEGFYHCFMRPYAVEKGHTNCPRCEALGAEQVVANLCNRMARASRRVNPAAEVVIWPYSAEHVWSADKAQTGLIEKLEPGVALLTEIEKDEYLEKPEGVRKHLWDYSIDLIGPGERAKQQIAACRERGIPIYLKSEPELSFEAPRLAHVPCHDRWWDRAEALASCGATGAWVFPAFRTVYGSSATEVNRLAWWTPAQEKDSALLALAARMGGGAEAGRHIREAWRKVSEAIPWSPELPSYYTGPYYLGPAQPMIANPEAPVPDVFNGYYLFMAEISDDEGLKKRPTYYTKPTGDVPVFTRYYRRMEELLAAAAEHMNAAAPLVPQRCHMAFDAENANVQWFYRTVRTEANFYESCMIRDRVLALVAKEDRRPEEDSEAAKLLEQWTDLLENERQNTLEALPVIERDPRLDACYGSDHTFSHTADMMRAKLEIMQTELEDFLPSLRAKLTPAAE